MGGGELPTSIGAEKEHNPFAAHTEEDAFVNFALTGLGSYTSYYRYMADINRLGPDAPVGPEPIGRKRDHGRRPRRADIQP